MCIDLSSGGGSALYNGDAFLHPVLAAYPEWGTAFCSDAAGSEASRRKIINKICDTGAYIMAVHFIDPAIAHMVRNKDRWKLKL